jgi:Flp pilus assembly pilin Flp
MRKLRYLADVLKEEKGIGVVEVILILVVLIGLVLIFKTQLTTLVETIFQKITSESAGI